MMSSQLVRKGYILILCQYVPQLKNVKKTPITETVKSEVSLPLMSAECVGTGSLSICWEDEDESDTIRGKVKSIKGETIMGSVKSIALLSSLL